MTRERETLMIVALCPGEPVPDGNGHGRAGFHNLSARWKPLKNPGLILPGEWVIIYKL
ncbi:MAG: hypothetical protein ACP5QG_08730 [candidate division WOR-3 bacterium]